MTSDLVFADELPEEVNDAHRMRQLPPWVVMIVDDDPAVHQVTQLVMDDFEFGGRKLQFLNAYNGSEADRLKAFETVKEHFGRDWLMLANTGYGSFESAPFGHNFKLSADEKRARKIGALEPWVAPAQ